MAHAWLDSLSEDWPSQLGSDASPPPQLPPLNSNENSAVANGRAPPSRLPLPMKTAPTANANDGSFNILSERSTNERNLPSSARKPSKLPNEIDAGPESRYASRTFSASTTGSVVHNTVNHRSTSASPNKKGHTPEWKRRLVYGEVPYGEQQDLFQSAATGLENMFKPPPPPQEGSVVDDSRQHSGMPSSPPIYRPAEPATPVYDDDDDDEGSVVHAMEGSPSPSPRKPREMTYKMVDESYDAGSLDSYSTQGHSQEAADSIAEESLSVRVASANGLAPPTDASRKTSGQSVVRNEDFSPIVLTKQVGNVGQVDFAPVEVPADQLKNRLEKLRINQMLLDSYAEGELDFSDLQEEGISGGPEDTDEFARQGGFLNTRRGGRSAEGSFRHRLLSPGMSGDTSDMLPEDSLQASTPKQFPTIRINEEGFGSHRFASETPPQLRAPFPSPEKQDTNPQSNGGSPLKLFGPYDTFTNQTLLRRISQFEDNSSNESRLSEEQGEEMQAYSQSLAAPSSPPRPKPSQFMPSARSVSQFGRGDLQGYQFGDVSLRSDGATSEEDESHVSVPATSSRNMKFDLEPTSPQGDVPLIIPNKRRQQGVTPSSSRNNRTVSFSSRVSVQYHDSSRPSSRPGPPVLATPKRDSGSEGKRPRTSPTKDPTPKRRRTLHKSDVAYGHEQLAALETVQDSHWYMQSMMGKRQEVRSGGFQQLAHPDVLAARQMSRPRTPTPSQRSSVQRERHPSSEIQPQEQSQSQSQYSPKRSSQLANGSMERNESTETDRKPSIKTQDFVEQAGAIMAMIRSGIKPPNGLDSVEESEEGDYASPSPDIQDVSFEESTREPLSRPPSRDGKPVTRVPPRQENPEVLDYLKKYQELSDMGDVISSSLRSMGLAQDAIRAAQEVEKMVQAGQDVSYPDDLDSLEDIISDPPNIRISRGPAADQNAIGPDYPSNISDGSTKSIPTGSSRGSESKKTILPASVVHLLPESVAGMYLDKQQNIWVKRRAESVRIHNILPSEDSEDDPFASIPDLTVDMTREMENLRLNPSQQTLSGDENESSGDYSRTPSSQRSKSYVTLSPNGAIPEGMSPQAQEELTKLESMVNSPTSDRDDYEEEMRVEDRNRVSPSRKNLTISFSSPIASIIHDVVPEDIDRLEDDTGSISHADGGSWSEQQTDNQYRSLTKNARKKLLARSKNGTRRASRNLAVQGQAFTPRPVSRIDEQDEDSQNERAHAESRQISILADASVVSHQDRQTSLSFVVSTPAAHHGAGAIISQNVGNLSLSPLSEFTMNNQDQSFGLEVSYLVQDRHLVTGDGSKKVLSMTVRDLVDRLTEVEPFEANWDDFVELDVSDKRLSSLHMLDEFCGRLVSLDASTNALSHLDGVPSTVRHLKASSNLLTELTSWDHLSNLQYIDVSNNELRSLAGLNNLVHLRGVRADNNKLTSLDGFHFHDGLLSLRARDNLIEELDFDGTKLDRLAELDLCGNKIQSIRNLGQLPSLETLKVQRNQLVDLHNEGPLPCLRHLDIGDNNVTSLDISSMPCLRVLHADRNRISRITGFARARYLDSISLREQRGDEPLGLAFLSAAYEVRKLFLSGNYIGQFEPQVDFLNLQLLELANCGLQSLPENLGQLMPNLRSLNLNFNAIADISPLRFIPRLKKLLMAGNRLANSTQVTEVVTEFPHLSKLDLRDNPMTQGFYAPLQGMVPVDRTGYVDPFMLPEADAERDALFAGRLDQATRLRRRLYQVVFVGCCARLKELDGLPVKRREALARDAAYEMLVKEGLLPGQQQSEETGALEPRRKGGEQQAKPHEQAEAAKCSDDSSRWNAEDSFA
ncbi:hypothetical protein VD0002_g543 [Verticillium dahliae]|uniref:Leucine-rich repeat-containing protein n=2 Tax=Verticillium dahliae TaxID=27337 RepID=G2XBQ1_VERDV|nr:leucine-rich repeat-containing protein [Verticillium dahliae VdLs.17]KAF3349440.1 hypothetical protein VdG2_02286 [Verticillium dahliae VDG2]KAH6699186.1 leucine-rich repeat-containing protein [Verticillium dahliae]EGY16523.1 leucine-rich repeat-containing protein [Verticillium dahliae VdLs.17]PNH32739.1 hypothetical protein BJF96_g3941 [Verticillium dahliae]PNH57258.1 hypothetical protein VD0003_g551 [Verticillium dahliae]